MFHSFLWHANNFLSTSLSLSVCFLSLSLSLSIFLSVLLSLCLSLSLPLFQIHTSLINDRPGAYDRAPALMEFTSARFIRLRLQRIRTLNADLMTLSYRDPKEVDPIVTRRVGSHFTKIK